jgi:hypothetical protein
MANHPIVFNILLEAITNSCESMAGFAVPLSHSEKLAL